MILEECISILKSDIDGFGDNWFSQFSFNDGNEIQSSVVGIFSRINSVANHFFEKLNLSILNGEYLEISNTQTILDQIISHIDTISSPVELPGFENIQDQISTSLLFNFINPVKATVRDYKSFLHGLNRELKHNEKSVLFEALSLNQTFSIANSQFAFNTAKLSRLVSVNIRLAQIDHNLSVKKEILNDLLILKNEIEKNLANSLKTIEDILIDKCNFLIKKILYRFQEDSKNYLYAFDFEDKELQPEDLQISCYLEFDKIMIAHYEKMTSHASQRKKWLDEVYTKIENETALNFKDYHVAIKEYKDETKNYAQVENLNAKFKEYYTANITSLGGNLFDKRALYVTYNYMLNNEFSFMLDQPDLSYETIEAKYKEIKNLQVQTRIKNFFPHIKFSGYLKNKIEQKFKSPEVDCDVTKKVIDTFESTLINCFEAYEWCKDKNFLAFQPPIKECKVDYIIEGTTYNLFMATSFVLPLNYEKILIELNELNRNLEKFKTLLEVHENLKVEKNTIKELRENIEKNDRRSIEILGVFSAIVLFASSSVQIFSIKDVHFRDALKFMLCFSYSLTIFIFLVWLITRENIKGVTRVHWVFFIGLSIIALLSLLFTLNWWPFN